VPALTFVGTANAIVYCGGIPHFVDSENKTLGIDAKKLERYLNSIVIFKKNSAINKFTKRVIRAIVPVHIFGHSCQIDEIIRIAKKFNLIVIEDAAEALGSYYKNKHLGTFGLAGCLSFNGNKIVTTGGGGAVITNNKVFAQKIRHLSTTAKLEHKWEYIHDQVGHNLRMPNINAALGLAQLENLNKFLISKRKLFNSYFSVFSKINKIYLFQEKKYCKSNYWLNAIFLKKKFFKERNKILKYAHQKNIFIRPAWKPLHKLKPFRNMPRMNLDNTYKIYNACINLPSSSYYFI